MVPVDVGTLLDSAWSTISMSTVREASRSLCFATRLTSLSFGNCLVYCENGVRFCRVTLIPIASIQSNGAIARTRQEGIHGTIR